jgi:hypothetical protein
MADEGPSANRIKATAFDPRSAPARSHVGLLPDDYLPRLMDMAPRPTRQPGVIPICDAVGVDPPA